MATREELLKKANQLSQGFHIMSLKTRELKAAIKDTQPVPEELWIDSMHRVLAHLDSDADELDYLLKKLQ